jgi:hypothetical protein
MSTIRYSNGSQQSTYRSATALSNDFIGHYAPSVMAEGAHHSRGDKYSFIPTIQVIDGLRAEGFAPYEVRQTKVRSIDDPFYSDSTGPAAAGPDAAG